MKAFTISLVPPHNVVSHTTVPSLITIQSIVITIILPKSGVAIVSPVFIAII
jgi:hypothetical protein